MSEPNIPSADELRAHWDQFAPLFEERMESTTVLLARELIAQLHLGEASALLEVGAGAGAAARVAAALLPAGARHVVTDLSPEMVRRARAKLSEGAEVREADACALDFPDASFDRFLCNLNLMLVPDADAALREAARVLKPGGLAAWSVWGRPEGSLMFTIPPLAAEEVGLDLPAGKRSNFHLGDREVLRARIADHGFEQVLTWYSPMIRPVLSGTEFAEVTLSTPRWEETLADQPGELRASLSSALERLAEEALGAGRPIGLEALVVIARRR
ncbi:MAG: class I SAM-dependent methyltransferase [Planctomycetes bacterium]|nr:class I SAM-dependent methyltransferase [Planctomycetota bacterium]